MKTPLSVLAVVAATAATAAAQSTWYVDANQPSVAPTVHATSITNLLATSPVTSGDTIRVVGILYNGSYQAYSDTVIVPGQTAEAWPITIPEGVTIQAYSAVPVFVAAGQSYSGATLFNISTTTASSTPTTFGSLNIAGGSIGISLDHAGSHARTAVLDDCNFAVNEIAVSARSVGAGSMTLISTDCSIRPDNGMLADIGIGAGKTNIGFRLHAEPLLSPSDAPSVSATIRGLRVFPFPNLPTVPPGLRPWNYQHQDSQGVLHEPDLASSTGSRKPSRVIDVYSAGAIAEYAGGTISPIPHVLVNLKACDLNGSQGNWDFGIYGSAEATTESQSVGDYHAGYTISVGSSKIYECGLAGVYGTVMTAARGSVDIGAGTEISDTGPLSSHTQTVAVFSGIHGFAEGGLLTFSIDDASSVDNTGHGLYLHAFQTRETPGPNPVGLHFSATDSQFHGNQGCGIATSAGPSMVALGVQSDYAMVGGTWHDLPNGGGLTFSQSSSHPDLRTGPGKIDRCAISNNGELGIYAMAGAPEPKNNVVNCRVTNNVVWNNALGGIFAQAGKGSGNPQTQIPGNIKMLLPIIHNTVVGNGSLGLTNPYNAGISAAEYSIEFYENLLSTGLQVCHFEYDDPLGVEDYATVVFKNVLDTAGQGSEDFGPGLKTTFGKAYLTVAPIPTSTPLNLGVDSNRALTASGTVGPFNSIPDTVPYLYGTPNLSLRSAPQFFLLNAGLGSTFSNATPFTQFGVNETLLDYSSAFRDPVVPGNFPDLPERGADEL